MLWLRRARVGFHCLNTSDANSSSFAHCNKHARVIKEVAMAAKASDNGVANYCETRSVENCTTKEIPRMVIVSIVTVDDDSRKNISKARKLDSIKLILP